MVRLTQVFAKLLNNAVKYTESAGRIEASSKRQRLEAVVSVRDSGVGIASDLLPRVFDLFTQIGIIVRRRFALLGMKAEVVDEFGSGVMHPLHALRVERAARRIRACEPQRLEKDIVASRGSNRSDPKAMSRRLVPPRRRARLSRAPWSDL